MLNNNVFRIIRHCVLGGCGAGGSELPYTFSAAHGQEFCFSSRLFVLLILWLHALFGPLDWCQFALQTISARLCRFQNGYICPIEICYSKCISSELCSLKKHEHLHPSSLAQSPCGLEAVGVPFPVPMCERRAQSYRREQKKIYICFRPDSNRRTSVC